MTLQLKEENMTISMDFSEETTPEEVLLGACDIISRVFSQKGVIEAYRRVNPDTMSIEEMAFSKENALDAMGKNRPCSQHYTTVKQFIHDSGAYKLYEYLFDKCLNECNKYDNANIRFPIPSINKMKIETGMERRSVGNALQVLKTMRLISEVDGNCIVHVAFLQNLIDAFLSLNCDNRKKFSDALKTGNVGALKELGLHDDLTDIDK